MYKEASKTLSKSYDIKEENKLFTFAYFLDFLACLGNTAYMKKDVSNAESVVKLFQRMEKSEGFSNFESKMHRTQSSSSSLLPPESVMKKLKKRKSSKDEEEKGDLLTQLCSKDSKPVKVTKSSKKDSYVPRKPMKVKKPAPRKKETEEISFDPEYSDEVKALIPQIKTIFSYYCSYGDTGNTTKLKSSTFQKLLKDAKIVK